MSCRTCPAAFVIEGAAPGERKVVCRVESTERGLREAAAGPVSVIRERTSCVSLHGYCLGDLEAYGEEARELGPLASSQQAIAAQAPRPHLMDYTACPSWQAEHGNRRIAKLVDLPQVGRRVHGAPSGA